MIPFDTTSPSARTFVVELYPAFLMQTASDLEEIQSRLNCGDRQGAEYVAFRVRANSLHFGAVRLANAADALAIALAEKSGRTGLIEPKVLMH